MDSVERAKYKQLANDAIIAEFGSNGLAARLAEALEKCVEELEWLSGGCQYCSYCEDHGDKAGDKPEPIEASDVLEIHGQLKERLTELEQVKDGLANADLGERLAQLKTDINKLEALVIP